MHKIIFFITLLVLFPIQLLASPGETPSYISKHIESAFSVGTGRMHYLAWDLYDAELYGPGGRWQDGQPLALSLTYLHDLKGQKIADKSIDLMKNQGLMNKESVENWRSQMTEIFPDVQKGSNLTGVLTSDGETIFYYDGKEAGRIADPEFGSRFFSIWLSPETTEPQLRSDLLGMRNQ